VGSRPPLPSLGCSGLGHGPRHAAMQLDSFSTSCGRRRSSAALGLSMTTADDLRARIAKVPRVRLAFLPTPLQHCARLSADLGVDLWIKRDDLTGLAFGGNKTRNLEFRMAEALEAGADVLVFGVEITSNSARQTAAAANAFGLPLVLVLRGAPEGEPQGN